MRYELDDKADLADEIFDALVAAYLASINVQLARLGRPPIKEITDPGVLDDLEQRAEESADSIVETYHSDLDGFLSSPAVAGLAGAALTTAVAEWASARAQWKSEQINVTEDSWARTQAAQDLAGMNRDLVAHGRIVPETAGCPECQAWVDRGLMDVDEADEFEPPHPGCDHEVEYEYEEVGPDALVWTP